MAASLTNLATARQNRGVSLEHIAETTKISMRFLRAIEAEDFEKLPGGIFATSYLKQYAEAAGVDEAGLLNAYARFVNEMAEPVVVQPALSRRFLQRWFRTAPAQ